MTVDEAIRELITAMTREALGETAETLNNLRAQVRAGETVRRQLELNCKSQAQTIANLRHDLKNAEQRVQCLRSDNDRLCDELRRQRDRSEAVLDGIVIG